MPRKMKFTVENASLATHQVETTFDGAPATLTVERAVIECLPADAAGKTFTMVLPADALDEFPEGSTIIVTASPAKEG